MSRLLHAAARGARLQVKDYYATRKWVTVDIRPSADSRPDEWRIHPGDAHLQYGPISSALRRMAGDDDEDVFSADEIPDWALRIAELSIVCGGWMTSWFHQSPDERRTALCVMAEALADEGL